MSKLKHRVRTLSSIAVAIESRRDHVSVDTKNLRINHLRIALGHAKSHVHRMTVYRTIAYIEHMLRPMGHGG